MKYFKRLFDFKLFSLLFLFSIVSFIYFLTVVDDKLLFNSTIYDQFVYVVTMSGILSFLSYLVCITLNLIFKKQVIRKWITFLLCAALISTTVFLLTDKIFANFDKLTRLVTFSVLALGMTYFLRLYRNLNKTVLHTVSIIIVAIYSCILISVVTKPFYRSKKARQVVLIVIDGFPSQYLNTYNKNINKTKLDLVFEKGLVFQNYHTNNTYTNGYFGSLYSGNQANTFHDPVNTSRNLFKVLQDLGVHTRWAAFHHNGVPEGSAQHTNVYSGIRSELITNNLSSIFSALGFDVNFYLNLSSDSSLRGLSTSPIMKKMIKLTSFSENKDKNPFTETLLKNMGQMKKYHNDSFIVFHIINHLGKSYSVFQDIEDKDPGYQQFMKKIYKNGYFYDKSDLFYKKMFEDDAREAMIVLGQMLNEFISKANLDEDDLIIITGDHGEIFDKNKMFYGYHPDEEVTKAPLVLFSKKIMTGVDYRYVQTNDIHRTILEFFNSKSFNRGISLLSEREKNKYTTTMTMMSLASKTWYLIFYMDGYKYVFNLYRGGDVTPKKYKLDNFDDVFVSSNDEIFDNNKDRIVKALKDYGLDITSIKWVDDKYKKLLAER